MKVENFFIALIVLILLLVSVSVEGARVVSVGPKQKNMAISQERGRHWKVKDRVCVYRRSKNLACGQVSKVISKGALVHLNLHKTKLKKGDMVRRALATQKKAKRVRRPTMTAQPTRAHNLQTTPKRKIYLYDFTLGFNGSPGFSYPVLHFQRMVSRTISLGLAPGVISTGSDDGNIKISAIGLRLSASYYSKGYFGGVWLMVNAGPDFFSVTEGEINETKTALTASATVGWRQQFEIGLNFGVAGGLQYTSSPNTESVDIDFNNLRPLLLVDAGFNF